MRAVKFKEVAASSNKKMPVYKMPGIINIMPVSKETGCYIIWAAQHLNLQGI
jgi:hypothetical protein